MLTGKLVERVEAGSIAEEIGLLPGDCVLSVNGAELGDILDWLLAESTEELLLAVQHADGSLTEYEIEKDYDEQLGLVFESPTLEAIRSCRNCCFFCFVDQQPPGMRRSLYLKDDDYRLSFVSASYITLTNLTAKDLERICNLHLSPLYVSVHTTDASLRQRLLGHRRAGEIMEVLRHLAGAGIILHTQAVLCPGLNDGAFLEKTVSDLYSLYPSVQTLAVVPVGLTAHRDGLYPLLPYDRAQAGAVLEQVNRWQERALKERGTRFVFASDELYTVAGHSIPQNEAYEGYQQLENGVGLVRLLYNDWEAWRDKLPQALRVPQTVTVATGLSAAGYLAAIVTRLNNIAGLSVRLVPVANKFFGGHVSVTGLLTASDLLAAFSREQPEGTLYLPQVMLKDGTDLFLDGYTVSDLSSRLSSTVRMVRNLTDFLNDLFCSESGVNLCQSRL